MEGNIDGFTYGAVTPVIAYITACFGSALGLRCTTRALIVTKSRRPGWLALGAGSIGSGIWTMHFIAMMGFTVQESAIDFDWSLTFGSLGLAIVVVGIGVFIVGYRGPTVPSLLAGGVITGLGVGAMHYMGMAAMSLHGATLRYDAGTVVLSLVIAVVAATAALWAAVQVKGLIWSLGASLVMGVAVTGMHYTGMAAVDVRVHDMTGSGIDPLRTSSSFDLLVPMLVGPLAFLVIAGAIVMLDPMMLSTPERERTPDRLQVVLPSLARGDKGRRPAGRAPQVQAPSPARPEDYFDPFQPAAPHPQPERTPHW